MQYKTSLLKIGLFIVLFVGIIGFVEVADAYHSWGKYHWARTANPFTLEVGDNVSSQWDSYLAITARDWSASVVLDTVVKPGKTKSRTCKATSGRVEVCSEKYGFNGWLGVAQIWASGNHITKGTVKVNDSYFNAGTYNTLAWRNLVMCQEVGHILGLDHQDEIFDNPNLNTCMDYTNDPSTNQHPNQHDYEELEDIYAHLDSFNTIIPSFFKGVGLRNNREQGNIESDIDVSSPSEWGTMIKADARGKGSLYARRLGNNEQLFTFVIWTE